MKPPSRQLPTHRLLEEGWEGLSDLELLALFLGPGNSDEKAYQSAWKISSRAVSLRSLAQESYSSLKNLGFSSRRATSLLAVRKLLQRSRQKILPPGHSFRSSKEVFQFFQPRLTCLTRECFWNVHLDGKNRIINIDRISEGSLTSSLVHPREVFRPAIARGAVGLLFAHNHPTGDPSPSREDIEVTRRLVETGRIVGIRVLDHVIIGRWRYFSFADKGFI